MTRPTRLAVSLGIAGVALAAIVLARHISSRDLRGDPGPRAFPVAAAIVVMVGSTAALVMDARGGARAPTPGESGRAPALLSAASLAYLVLMPLAGYTAATTLFLAGISLSLDRPRRHPVISHLLVAAGASLTSWYVFGRLLEVVLPAGPLGY